jgi:hypothetical protein
MIHWYCQHDYSISDQNNTYNIQYIHTYIFTKTYNIIINPNSINSPSHHVLISLTVWHSSTTMRDSQFLNGELLFFNKATNSGDKGSKLHQQTHTQSENCFPWSHYKNGRVNISKIDHILNAKSLDRNCSSIMLRRGTI